LEELLIDKLIAISEIEYKFIIQRTKIFNKPMKIIGDNKKEGKILADNL
jgi:hypothetical protein